jgi:uncharacterized protein (DUF1778 family)
MFSPVSQQNDSHGRLAMPSDCLVHQINTALVTLQASLLVALTNRLNRAPPDLSASVSVPISVARAQPRSLGPRIGLKPEVRTLCVPFAMAPDHDDEIRQPKSGRLGLRTNDWQRSILAAASRAEGSTISEFVLKYATRAAEEVLADRRAFVLSEPQWTAFTDALDRPPRSFLRLRGLMESAATSTSTSD